MRLSLDVDLVGNTACCIDRRELAAKADDMVTLAEGVKQHPTAPVDHVGNNFFARVASNRHALVGIGPKVIKRIEALSVNRHEGVSDRGSTIFASAIRL